MARRRKSGDGNYDVGYGRPPKHTRFSSTHQPPRRRNKKAGSNEVIEILDATVEIQTRRAKRRMSAFEVAVRKLVQTGLNNHHLGNAVEFVHLCEMYKVVTPPPAPRIGGVLEIPDGWDRDEWMAMLERYGPPPWPGPRNGLPKQQAPVTEAEIRSPALTQVGADPDRSVGYRNPPRQHQFRPGMSGNPKGRSSRTKTRKLMIERVASERHEVLDNGMVVTRTTLELALMVIRARSHEGNKKAFQAHHRFLEKFGPQPADRKYGFLVVPERRVRTIDEIEQMAAKVAENQARLRALLPGRDQDLPRSPDSRMDS